MSVLYFFHWVEIMKLVLFFESCIFMYFDLIFNFTLHIYVNGLEFIRMLQNGTSRIRYVPNRVITRVV